MPARATADPQPASVTPMHPEAEIPVLRLKQRTGAAEKVPLFTLSDPVTGDEVEYSIPRKPGANIGLMYVHIASGQPCTNCTAPHGRGEFAAQDYLLRVLLGADGYKALREFEDLESADLGAMVAIMVKLALGAIEAPKEPVSA